SGTIESLRTQAPELAMLMEPLGITSFLFLTMQTGEELAGALGFYHCTTTQHWHEQDYSLLQLATGLIGSTLRRWKNEEKLRESESLLRTLFDILPVGVSIVDPQRRPIQLNRAVGQILGMEVSEILAGGYRQIEYLYPDGTPMPFDAFPTIRAANGEIVRDAEIRIIRPDGKQRWTSISAAPLPVAGMGAAIVTLDITERKESEAQREFIQRKLLEAQRLESLAILAGGVAHDFNNILSTILGYAELARLDTPPGSEVHDSLNAIMLGARRAAELTAQMLAYAGRGAFHLVPVDLNLIVREQSDLISLTLPPTIAIHYHLEPDLPQIYGDETQLRQMLRSLLTNAIEAIEAIEHGVITVTTGQWEVTTVILAKASISAAEPGPCAYLEIHDTGCGIEVATIRRIFDPFFSTKFTGRGLGLAAVQGIVQAHHGALIVESEPAQGSRFRICLPFATNE
ncbi:MAG: PAS domain S-box protein, partial [Chloroflexia bacterium]|nr:PAS domain S-box protein [Chloroflexia bacterium]